MRRDRAAWGVRVRRVRRNREAHRAVRPGACRFVPPGSPSPSRPGRAPRREARTDHPDPPPPACPTAAVRRLTSAWERFFARRAGGAAPLELPRFGGHHIASGERRAPVSAHHRRSPARLRFPPRAAGGACAGPGADPVRSPLLEAPAPMSGPEAVSVRKSLQVDARSRMKPRSRRVNLSSCAREEPVALLLRAVSGCGGGIR